MNIHNNISNFRHGHMRLASNHSIDYINKNLNA